MRKTAAGGCILAVLLGGCAGTKPGTEVVAPGPPVTVTAFGPTAPANAPGQSLYLVRYEIAPATRLKPHHHEGTQIGMVESGELTYHVLTGAVPVYRHGADGAPVHDRTVVAGAVDRLTAGEWVVEEPDDHHWAANEGTAPLVIYTATFLREGAPLATPDPPS